MVSETTSLAEVILVTGCYRSGTTLLEKLLHQRRDFCIGSQPFPILYFHVKSQFLASRRLDRRYPLGHLFLEDAYNVDDFGEFLENHELSQRDLNSIFDQLASYHQGLWTPEVLSFRNQVQSGSFTTVYQQLHLLLSQLLDRHTASLIGSKEVLCEEYIPFLLSRGAYIVVSVRDPRDMICSLDYGPRDNLTGNHRPLLFSLRAWRKSVAYILKYESHPRFAFIRYEDLVADADHALAQLPLPCVTSDRADDSLIGQDGNTWRGNSSFHDHLGVSTKSVGRFRSVLPDQTIAYIETTCAPEMMQLGYRCEALPAPAEETLSTYREPFTAMHATFPTGYSHAPARVKAECERLRLLSTPSGTLDRVQQHKWFLFPAAFNKLRQTASRCEGQ